MKKIAVATTTRADFGLLTPLLKCIQQDSSLELQLIATGSHFSKRFGETYKEIEECGIPISAKIELRNDSDDPNILSNELASLQKGLSQAFLDLKPDLLIILGDRYELLTLAQTALLYRIPLAHLHGGEITEGAFDDSIRHAITKLSHLHFTATDEYRKRVIQLGENPERVFNVGALGVDLIYQTQTLTKTEIETELGIQLNEKNFLITFHPETLDSNYGIDALKNLLACFDQMKKCNFFFTGTNSDPGSVQVQKKIDEFCKRNPNSKFFSSLGSKRYFSLLKYSTAVLGNSSSGIYEAAQFKIPTLNIGNRQKGRIRPKSVIDSDGSIEHLKHSLERITQESFLRTAFLGENPYGDGHAAKKITACLKNVDYNSLLTKVFFDASPESFQ